MGFHSERSLFCFTNFPRIAIKLVILTISFHHLKQNLAAEEKKKE